MPFEIHQSSGILTVSSTAGLKELKPSYNLEVVASDGSQEIATAVTIHITKDPKDDASIEQFADKLNDLPETLEYSVRENVEGNGNTRDGNSDLNQSPSTYLFIVLPILGAVVANLSIFIHEHKRGGGGSVSAHLIANDEARERCVLSEKYFRRCKKIFVVFRFVLSEAGLLLTARPLDREERDSYMVTMVMGRKGILRGKQAIQVKVSGD